MFDRSFFSSRSEKEVILKEIIKNLTITESEKELYIFSIELLDEEDFLSFYTKITNQFPKGSLSKYSIEPLSSTII